MHGFAITGGQVVDTGSLLCRFVTRSANAQVSAQQLSQRFKKEDMEDTVIAWFSCTIGSSKFQTYGEDEIIHLFFFSSFAGVIREVMIKLVQTVPATKLPALGILLLSRLSSPFDFSPDLGPKACGDSQISGPDLSVVVAHFP